jgi:hypothetical protein
LFFEVEPWGALRDDMRAAANTLWSKGVDVGGETPDLVFPYFEDTADVAERAKQLDAKIAELRGNANA